MISTILGIVMGAVCLLGLITLVVVAFFQDLPPD